MNLKLSLADPDTPRNELCALLQDAVHGGASVGFMQPLNTEEAGTYWLGVLSDLSTNHLLWLARKEGRIVGAVQLERCAKANGRHRGEVQKLLVLAEQRRQGIAAQLLDAVETHARQIGLKLLVLDTESGSAAERLYLRHGWHSAGRIPDYAASPDGALHATHYLYKTL